MSWNRFHRRSETLRAVVETLDAEASRGRATLPWDLPGVAENFADESDLVGALLLRWHARLSANLERELEREPSDLAAAVVAAWRRTAREHAGIRAVVDDVLTDPATAALEDTVLRARDLERARLAAAAGLASARDPRAVAVGERLELRARGVRTAEPTARRSEPATVAPVAPATSVPVPADPAPVAEEAPAPEPHREVNESFVRRLKAALAAA